jgi:hypothetical protein
MLACRQSGTSADVDVGMLRTRSTEGGPTEPVSRLRALFSVPPVHVHPADDGQSDPLRHFGDLGRGRYHVRLTRHGQPGLLNIGDAVTPETRVIHRRHGSSPGFLTMTSQGAFKALRAGHGVGA